jgi:hypothetical protein
MTGNLHMGRFCFIVCQGFELCDGTSFANRKFIFVIYLVSVVRR